MRRRHFFDQWAAVRRSVETGCAWPDDRTLASSADRARRLARQHDAASPVMREEHPVVIVARVHLAILFRDEVRVEEAHEREQIERALAALAPALRERRAA